MLVLFGTPLSRALLHISCTFLAHNNLPGSARTSGVCGTAQVLLASCVLPLFSPSVNLARNNSSGKCFLLEVILTTLFIPKPFSLISSYILLALEPLYHHVFFERVCVVLIPKGIQHAYYCSVVLCCVRLYSYPQCFVPGTYVSYSFMSALY